MNAVTLFSHPDFGAIRTAEIDGQILFVGRDVAAALGYADTVNALKTHCRGVVKHHLPSSSGSQGYSMIPESDVYRLIMRSQLQAAEAFHDWVTSEVLPSIRKTGAYFTEGALERLTGRIEKLEERLSGPVRALSSSAEAKPEFEAWRAVRLLEAPGTLTRQAALYEDWLSWAAVQDNAVPGSTKAFGMWLNRIGVKKVRRMDGCWRVGVVAAKTKGGRP